MAVKKKNKPKSSNSGVYYICYKDEIVPTADQRSFIRFNFGAKRWLKNRMLEDDLFMYNEMGIHLHNTPADYKDQEVRMGLGPRFPAHHSHLCIRHR